MVNAELAGDGRDPESPVPQTSGLSRAPLVHRSRRGLPQLDLDRQCRQGSQSCERVYQTQDI